MLYYYECVTGDLRFYTLMQTMFWAMRGHFFSHFQSDLQDINTSHNMATPEMTEAEMEVVTAVFKSFETGLREATIYPKVIDIEFQKIIEL